MWCSQSPPGFITPTATFEGHTNTQNLSDGVANPVALVANPVMRHVPPVALGNHPALTITLAPAAQAGINTPVTIPA